MLSKRVGRHAQDALLAEVERGAYQLEPFAPADVSEARRLLTRYADLGIRIADASVVVIAGRYGVSDVLTLDERHFRALKTRDGKPFRLLPSDQAIRG